MAGETPPIEEDSGRPRPGRILYQWYRDTGCNAEKPEREHRCVSSWHHVTYPPMRAIQKGLLIFPNTAMALQHQHLRSVLENGDSTVRIQVL